MKKLLSLFLSLALLVTFAFAEYRFIMHNIQPYIAEEAENGAIVYLVLFGFPDTYYAENLWNE